ncbi:SDR family NAD(P)-dependent oxidoreductase [Laspinema sp. A4]|uniref:SDR family NAD(P)-dependent oxidoreductase n=1 Tax=Laspinema sp. D2d TaxID=2953686 RepID=UPI0021BB078C|nr:SDR family NAD(P)-dependent oxidoreductase [Laspinema sp. D2d]MCT7983476.1 SDR family NAD(P)-dependent oxidoreductase [Laspinema sp. D2d]
MTKSLEGKVAVVTGATRGLGKGIAIGLGEAGATVYITGRSLDPTRGEGELAGSLKETEAAVEAAGGLCIPVQVDHSDDDQVRSLFDRIQSEFGQLDLLVNNVYAGVQTLMKSQGRPFWESEPSFWDACNNVGLRSHYVTSVLAARMMTPRQQGLICTISSWGGLSYIFGVPYGVGKSGCDRLAADMAVELKPYNVTSLSIWPGIVGTELMSSMVDQMAVSETDDRQFSGFRERYNWETPLLTGRAIAALAADPTVMQHTGRVQIVAEVAQRYGLVDEDGTSPVSLRSLRFVLPFAVPQLRPYAGLVPNFNLPWSLMLLSRLGSPRLG